MASSTRSPSFISTPTTQPSSSSSSARKPSKKSSFLSLRREKKPADPLGISSPTEKVLSREDRSNRTSPSSFHGFESGNSSRPSISHPVSLNSHRSGYGYQSRATTADASSGRREKSRQTKPSFDDFGSSIGDSEYIPWPVNQEESPDIRRSATTGRSIKQSWEQQAFADQSPYYPFRDSGSSTLSQLETPPQTPIDEFSFYEPIFSMPDLVAAPIAGVETMDALVDGMNGVTVDHNIAGLGNVSSRSQFLKTGHHPLYHPPLPTPPPGVTLGRPLARKRNPKHDNYDSDIENDQRSPPGHLHRNWDKQHRRDSSRTASSSTVTRLSTLTTSTSSSILSLSSAEDRPRSTYSFSEDVIPDPINATLPQVKTVAPSISDIIRAHAPPSQQVRSRPTLSHKASYTSSQDHSIYHDALELPPDPLTSEEESDMVSRSSVDTIAEEVRQTLRNQSMSPMSSRPPSQHQSLPSGTRPQSTATDYTRSSGHRNSSLTSSSMISERPPLPAMDLSGLTKNSIHSPSQAIAQYLRSSRLTTVMKLTRAPYASRDSPLDVSFSDLGSTTGTPLVVFLGLGCVRHIMGLYDEMAECLGIRLITIDRWGLGRTGPPRSKLAKGIPDWAYVVEEILDRLHIDQCSVMAHSAGAPYALAFANRFPERIRGNICLLAPWVGGGEGAGYKWLKYVPNGILKTAQAAEWKVQAWMLGKPPTLAYEGIGFDVQASSPQSQSRVLHALSGPTLTMTNPTISSVKEANPRPSMCSSAFSDYDDLHDFDGKFDSRSTLGRRSSVSQRNRTISESRPSAKTPTNRKPSRGFLGRFKGGTSTAPHSPQDDHPVASGPGKRLKALRSMGSLKGRSAAAPAQPLKKASSTRTPSLTQSPGLDVGLGIGDFDWTSTMDTKSTSTRKSIKSEVVSSLDLSIDTTISSPRMGGRRSISFGASVTRGSTRESIPPVPILPPMPSPHQPDTPSTPGYSYQAALGNALIAASHAESSKGTHGDLLQILNHDRQPWGFNYSTYPHAIRVWYGDHDEKIAENAVRWMENTMGRDKCRVNVVKGADHALMFKSGVVVEVLEYISECWRSD